MSLRITISSEVTLNSESFSLKSETAHKVEEYLVYMSNSATGGSIVDLANFSDVGGAAAKFVCLRAYLQD